MGRRIAAAAVALAIAFGAVTLAALEGKSVALVATTSPAGEVRRTRVWFAEEGGALWIESATDSRPFYLDLQARPSLTMEIMGPPWTRGTRLARGHAELVPEPGGTTAYARCCVRSTVGPMRGSLCCRIRPDRAPCASSSKKA